MINNEDLIKFEKLIKKWRKNAEESAFVYHNSKNLILKERALTLYNCAQELENILGFLK
jgi:hypothetical protein